MSFSTMNPYDPYDIAGYHDKVSEKQKSKIVREGLTLDEFQNLEWFSDDFQEKYREDVVKHNKDICKSNPQLCNDNPKFKDMDPAFIPSKYPNPYIPRLWTIDDPVEKEKAISEFNNACVNVNNKCRRVVIDGKIELGNYTRWYRNDKQKRKSEDEEEVETEPSSKKRKTGGKSNKRRRSNKKNAKRTTRKSNKSHKRHKVNRR